MLGIAGSLGCLICRALRRSVQRSGDKTMYKILVEYMLIDHQGPSSCDAFVNGFGASLDTASQDAIGQRRRMGESEAIAQLDLAAMVNSDMWSKGSYRVCICYGSVKMT